MLLTRLLGSALSPGGARGGLSVLIFHRVLPTPDPLFPDEPDADRFAEILDWVGRSFNVLPLDRAITDLCSGTLPPRALAITFDDGYADNYTVALPVLERFGFHATFFVASSFLDGGRMWNDTVIESIRACAASSIDLGDLGQHDLSTHAARRQAIDRILPQVKYLVPSERLDCVSRIAERCGIRPPDDLMMTSEQLRSLHGAGMGVGGHTRTHPILARLPDSDARAEIEGGKADLETILGRRLTLFAYPNGKPGVDYDSRHTAMVKECGFDAAVSTSAGTATTGSDLMQLPRFTPWDRTQLRFCLRLFRNTRTAVRLAT